MSLMKAFRHLCQQKSMQHDPRQERVMKSLEVFAKRIITPSKFFNTIFTRDKKKLQGGIFLWGCPGGGKTMMVSLFCEYLYKHGKSVLELHQHDFNCNIADQLNLLSHKHKDPVKIIVDQWSKQYDLIFLDDIHLTDIVGVAIFQKIWQYSKQKKILWLISANRSPDMLYKGGVGRENFLETIDDIKHSLQVIHIETIDYRKTNQDRLQLTIGSPESNLSQGKRVFKRITKKQAVNENILINHRPIAVLGCHDSVLLIDFLELCSPPRSQRDYFVLAKNYQTIIICNVQEISLDNHNLAISWIRCIDIFYNRSVNIFIMSQVELEEIYSCEGVYAKIHERTLSRLYEMLAG